MDAHGDRILSNCLVHLVNAGDGSSARSLVAAFGDPAGSVSGSVFVLALKNGSILVQIVDGVVGISTVASEGSGVAVHELLFTEDDLGGLVDDQVGFEGAYCAEGPAGAALSLVLDRVELAAVVSGFGVADSSDGVEVNFAVGVVDAAEVVMFEFFVSDSHELVLAKLVAHVLRVGSLDLL